MTLIQEQTLNRAIVLLTAIGAKYAIIDANGKVYGELEVVQPKPKRKASTVPLGTYREWCRKNVGQMKIGDVVVLDCSEFGMEKSRNILTSWACNNWGNGTMSTAKNKITGKLEVLRIA